MRKTIVTLNIATLTAVLSVGIGSAQAGISLDRTRMILTGNSVSVSANLSNTSPDVPFLAQSWVEDAKGNKITSPLLVLPALQRINGGQKGVIRVTKTNGIDSLPQDRESIFYLNVREIPPKPKKANVLQLSMQSRIKLFYRPTPIIPDSKNEVWQSKLAFKKEGDKFVADNPTPYFITVIGLTKGSSAKGGERLTTFPGIMIPPKSTLDVPVTNTSVNEFSMMYVNDYGGHPEIRYRCEGTICHSLPDDQVKK